VVTRRVEDAAWVLRLAEGRPALLLSAAGAGGFLGPRGWLAMVAQARAAAPGAPCLDALCCGDAPGHALAALRAGCRLLVLDGACPAFPMVTAAAAEAGARVLPARPPAFDPQGWDLRRPAARHRLSLWLTGAPHDSAVTTG
jgi:hypothetical protein